MIWNVGSKTSCSRINRSPLRSRKSTDCLDQYTPEKLLKMYKDSLLLELKHYSIVEYSMFRKAQIVFERRRKNGSDCRRYHGKPGQDQ